MDENTHTETAPQAKPKPKIKAKPGRKPITKIKRNYTVGTEILEDGRTLRGNKVSGMAEIDMSGAPERKDGEDEVVYLERLLNWKRIEAAKAREDAAKAANAGADHNGRKITHPQQGPWNVARARKVYVQPVSHMGQRVTIQLGNLPNIEILRGRWVIIPHDAYTVLQDCTTKHEFHDMNVYPPIRLQDDEGIEKTNYPFQDGGECTWDEYVEFRETEKKKPYTIVNRQRVI